MNIIKNIEIQAKLKILQTPHKISEIPRENPGKRWKTTRNLGTPRNTIGKHRKPIKTITP
jgi:hypothetical protein